MIELVLKLIEFIQTWFWVVSPIVICGDDQRGVIRRRGIYSRDLVPGINWKWPLLEAHLVEISALDSIMLREQTLTTKDGYQVTLRGVIACRVVDPRKYILDCATASSVINDIGSCVIGEVVPDFTLDEVLRGTDFSGKLLTAMRRRGKKWGIDVESVGLVDRVQTKAYRLINSNSNSSNHDSGV